MKPYSFTRLSIFLMIITFELDADETSKAETECDSKTERKCHQVTELLLIEFLTKELADQ